MDPIDETYRIKAGIEKIYLSHSIGNVMINEMSHNRRMEK